MNFEKTLLYRTINSRPTVEATGAIRYDRHVRRMEMKIIFYKPKSKFTLQHDGRLI
jgi:hypothetical protein